jgi:hypothetical protein
MWTPSHGADSVAPEQSRDTFIEGRKVASHKPMLARICACPSHRASWRASKPHRTIFALSHQLASENLALVDGPVVHQSTGVPSGLHLGSLQTDAQSPRVAQSFWCKAPREPARQVGSTGHQTPKPLQFVDSPLGSDTQLGPRHGTISLFCGFPARQTRDDAYI